MHSSRFEDLDNEFDLEKALTTTLRVSMCQYCVSVNWNYKLNETS
jgi:hypothetical protein